MKLKVTEGSVVVDDKAASGEPVEHKAGSVFERHKDQTVMAWLESGAVEEVTEAEK